jgi:hypothetical protein
METPGAPFRKRTFSNHSIVPDALSSRCFPISTLAQPSNVDELGALLIEQFMALARDKVYE